MTIQRLALIAGLVAFGAACDTEADVEETFPGAETTTQEPALTPSPDDQTGAGTAAATLQVDSLTGVGPYITDANGRAVYLLEGESADSSTCYDECARAWPPVIASGATPRAGGEAIEEGLIDTIERRDGSMQVTYGGHPLYYYQEDQGPGDTAGQDVTDEWGEWYLVRPEGEPLESEGS